VPLLASGPGVVTAGVCGDLVDLSDFLPTLAELAGAPLPHGLDGRSFAPQLRGEPGRPRTWVYSGQRGRSFLRDERWKLSRDGALHDLARDPDETAPIAPDRDTAESAAARARLLAYVRAYFPGGELP
jgi:arylsulfatase A